MQKSIIVLALVVALLGGCAKQTFVLDNNPREMMKNGVFFSEEPFADNSDASAKQTHNFFIHGIAQGQAINLAYVCGGLRNVAKVETQTTFINGLLGAITFGIYTPRDARVYCRR
ncbi:MAG: lipoprotein bor [Proteobacteria bacterium]|nr:lipoprotein bor [Pseudomonadota bacterium]